MLLRNCLLLTAITIAFSNAHAQVTPVKGNTFFDSLMARVTSYKLDTTQPPADRSTALIQKLRELKGGFNVNDVIKFKLEEDRQKKDITETQYSELLAWFNGQGMEKLNNAVTWIYRNNFTEKELKQLVKFYGTDAGRKMSSQFPVIMLQSMAAAEMIKNQLKPSN